MRRLTSATCAALLALLGCALAMGLLGGTPTGIADNGDGSRVYCGAGLVPQTPTGRAAWLGGVVFDFDRTAPCADPQPSAAVWALRLAGAGQDPFSLTRLGWLYALGVALVTAAAAWALSRRGGWWPLLLLPAAAPLANQDFVRFFLSTFAEPPGLLGTYAVLCGTIAIAATSPAHRPERVVGLVLTAGGGVLAVLAKVSFLPVLGIALLVCLLTVVGTHRWRRLLTGPAVAVAVGLLAVGPVTRALDWQEVSYPGVNSFNLAYTLVLTEVPGSAAELGLPEAAQDYAGNGYYPNGPEAAPGAPVVLADPAAVRGASWAVLMTNPGALLRALGNGLIATEGRELDYLADYPWEPGNRPLPVGKALSGAQGADPVSFRGWLGGFVVPWKPFAVAGLGLLLGLVTLFVRRHPVVLALGRAAGLATVTALGLVGLAVLGDGYFEVAKHVWLAAYLLDAAMLAGVGALLALVVSLVRRRPADPVPLPDHDDAPTVEFPRVTA
ncbi:glycan biosynthesis hexose transferase WsfD [Actinokineospora bangkokensis]|uniref:glycan biosynthesis hexose transferase WsfD n=1 Tax=Actinokineospora bangkokensis TaxID=1193682 RepID=UPI001300F4C8|nr:hypothetical protein [Actinokineospora bangkokensis]